MKGVIKGEDEYGRQNKLNNIRTIGDFPGILDTTGLLKIIFK